MSLLEAGSRAGENLHGRQERLVQVLQRIKDAHQAVLWTARFVEGQMGEARSYSMSLEKSLESLFDAGKIFDEMEKIATGLHISKGDEKRLAYLEKTVAAFDKLYTYLKSMEESFVKTGSLTPQGFDVFVGKLQAVQSVTEVLREDLRVLKIEA